MTKHNERLEHLRSALRGENISYGELAELQGLKRHIKRDDVELREASGMREYRARPRKAKSQALKNRV